MTCPRLTVAARFLLALCAVAALSIGLALLLQNRSLSKDLERAASARFERSAHAAGRLLENHLRAMAERYRAVAGTPQFRANLEVEHKPTLRYYADRLASQQSASLILFADREDEANASGGGDAELVAAALGYLRAPPVADCILDAPRFAVADCPYVIEGGAEASFLARDGGVFAIAAVPLSTGDRLLGRLVALEPVPAELLEGWSQLCGASVSIARAGERDPEVLESVARRVGELEIRVTTSLRPERHALANSRRSLLTAGLIALALTSGASLLLARGLVRPILEIQNATDRIGAGDLTLRLGIERGDEIGDVARGFNLMLERLEATQGRLSNAQRLARLGNWAVDAETGEWQGSEEFRRIYAIDSDEGPVTHELLLSRAHPEDRDRVQSAIEEWLHEGRPFRLDHRIVQPNGEERILHIHGERTAAEDGKERLEGTVQDVTERKLVEEQVRYLAYHDSLTGLGNRRLLREHLNMALEQAQRGGYQVGALFLDIDNFKVINDTLGHSAGDELLKCVADRLLTTVRSVEAPGDSKETLEASVTRLGGDEFMVLLSRIDDSLVAEEVARRLLRAMSEPFDLKDREIVVTSSVGITTGPEDGDDVESILRNSDTALHHAKSLGRSKYHVYTDSLKEAAFKRLTVESKLRSALKNDELLLQYQPKVELATGKVTGLEALVRWRDPELGIVLPDEFIPLAEETGLIVPVGEWVLRTAAAQAKAWQDVGLAPLRVSVNVSAFEVEGTAIAKTVAEVLDETGLNPGDLELEITETTLLRDEDKAIAWLHLLKDMGVSLSLDDFGTGYSSLSYLRRLPIDTLKIDRSFVRRIANDPDDAALAGAIISMAKALRLRVVVEGVETEEQRELLSELACDEVQGFLFGVPVPAEEVPRLLAEVQAQRRPKRRRRTRDGGAKPRTSQSASTRSGE